MLIFDDLENRDVVGRQFTQCLLKSKTLRFISPYISQGTWNPLKQIKNNSKIEYVDIICDLENPACNPKAVRELSKDSRIRIKYMAGIHAKVYIFDQEVLITSANFTPNGMDCGLIEAGCIENDVTTANIWYDSLWKYAQDVPCFENEIEWNELVERWTLMRAKKMQVVLTENEKPHILDLLRSENQYDNIAFCLWYDSSVKTGKKFLMDNNETLKSVSDSISWDFFVEDYSKIKEKSALKKINEKFTKVDEEILVNIQINKTNHLPRKRGCLFELSKSMKIRMWGKKDDDNGWEICSIYQNLNEINMFTLADKTKVNVIVELLLKKLEDKDNLQKWNDWIDKNLGYVSFADMQKFLGFRNS